MLENYINKVIQGDNVTVLKDFPDSCIDLTVTSPPYDNLRDYEGYSFDFENLAKELYRVTAVGGVVVWVVGDATVDGSETGTSFRQALYFKDAGFNLHDTMIWEKDSFSFPNPTRYRSIFEFMFIFSKGQPKTVNLIKDKINKYAGTMVHGTSRGADGVTFTKSNHNKSSVEDVGVRNNIFKISAEKDNKYNHPAPFPEKLAQDHIYSWSNEGDIVLDPFNGSGTTTKMAKHLSRKYIGIELSEKYCAIANERLAQDLLF